MDILFLSHRLPYPPNKGDKIRSHALLTHLAKRHTVHLACFIDDPADMQHIDTVRGIAGGQCLFVPLSGSRKRLRCAAALVAGTPFTTACFGSGKIAAWVAELVRSRPIEHAIVFSSAMAQFLPGHSGLDSARVVMDMVDMDSDKWRQYSASARWPMRWIYRREAELLFGVERDAARRFGATLLSSPFETASFAAVAPEAAGRLYTFPNGVDLTTFSPGRFPNPFPEGETPIVMTGRFDYRPNADGARWFAREIMPHIKRRLAHARFYAVGANPPSALRALAGESVTITGNVADVRSYIQHAAAAVAPLRMARGVQNKVLEAMAMAKPVVATREATRALEVSPGEHLWIENDPVRFADAVAAACEGPDRERIAANGRNFVQANHAWSSSLAVVDRLLEKLSGRTGQGADAPIPLRARWRPAAAMGAAS